MACTSPQKKKMRDRIRSLYIHLKIIYCVLIVNLVIYGIGIWLCYSTLKGTRTSLFGNENCETKVIINQDESFIKTNNHSDFNSDEKPTSNRNRRAFPSEWKPDVMKANLKSKETVEYCTSLYNHCNVQNRGEPGPPGPKGSRGEKGEKGLDGLKGDRGLIGRAGSHGEDGIPGQPGIKGDRGPIGPRGKSGQKGENGHPGVRGPTGKSGPRGLPGPKGLKGDLGNKGERGLLGFPGFKGNKGEPAPKGDKGEIGQKGNLGPMGIRGLKGVQGDRGNKGERGRRGYNGLPGNHGAKGPRGKPGIRGLKGEKGDRGIRGPLGGSNCTCLKGEKGEKGQRGLIGFTGYKGDKGDPGHKGSKGYGAKGHRGYEGLRGPKGDKGDRGDAVFSSSVAMGDWKMATHVPPVTYRAGRTPSSPGWKDVVTSLPTTTTTKPPPKLAPRKRECRIKLIGIPLFERKAGGAVGSWMKDPAYNGRFWSTESVYGSSVYEFRSSASFSTNTKDNTYDLRFYHYYGTDHVVYQGSFFYHWAGRHIILKFDLNTAIVTSAVEFPEAAYNNSMYLYKKGKSYFDIEVDENGMWVIYRRTDDPDNTYVAKLNYETMTVIRTWKLNVQPGTYGNGFVVCGILYLIRDTFEVTTVIDYAYNFYTDTEVANVNIEFKNPYGANCMVTYVPNSNVRESRLFGWDRGRQISYPMLW